MLQPYRPARAITQNSRIERQPLAFPLAGEAGGWRAHAQGPMETHHTDELNIRANIGQSADSLRSAPTNPITINARAAGVPLCAPKGADMPEVIDQHIDAMVQLNLVSYHRGMQDGLAKAAHDMDPGIVPREGGPCTEGLRLGLDYAAIVLGRLKAKSARLCHESRGEHECDEYCPPPF